MSEEGAAVCSQERYQNILNELRINYQMYYDNRTISHQDFYRRRLNLIMKLRTLDINQEKTFMSNISSYPFNYENENQN